MTESEIKYKSNKAKAKKRLEGIPQEKKDQVIDYAIQCISIVPTWLSYHSLLIGQEKTIRVITAAILFKLNPHYVFYGDITKKIKAKKISLSKGKLDVFQFASLCVLAAKVLEIKDFKIDVIKLMTPCFECGNIPGFGFMQTRKKKKKKNAIVCTCGIEFRSPYSKNNKYICIRSAKVWSSWNASQKLLKYKDKKAVLNEYIKPEYNSTPPKKWAILANSIPVNITAALVTSESWENI